MKRVAYTVKKFGDHTERRSYAKTKNGKAAEPSRFVDELLEDG